MEDKTSSGPRWMIAPDHETLSRRASEFIAEEMRRRPDLLLCAAAGSSPRRAYVLLGDAARQNAFGQNVRVLKVDEWGGLGRTDSGSCEADLQGNLLRPLRVSPERYQGFRGDAPEPEAECQRISEWLARNGPIDLCVLGVGTNGHIAMNEPADTLRPHAHVAALAPSSLDHSMLQGSAHKPKYGLSLGMADILQSRKILLLASGIGKRPVIERFREGVVRTSLPVSFLWLHPDLTIICDQAANAVLD